MPDNTTTNGDAKQATGKGTTTMPAYPYPYYPYPYPYYPYYGYDYGYGYDYDGYVPYTFPLYRYPATTPAPAAGTKKTPTSPAADTKAGTAKAVTKKTAAAATDTPPSSSSGEGWLKKWLFGKDTPPSYRVRLTASETVRDPSWTLFRWSVRVLVVVAIVAVAYWCNARWAHRSAHRSAPPASTTDDPDDPDGRCPAAAAASPWKPIPDVLKRYYLDHNYGSLDEATEDLFDRPLYAIVE